MEIKTEKMKEQNPKQYQRRDKGNSSLHRNKRDRNETWTGTREQTFYRKNGEKEETDLCTGTRTRHRE
jgi:hypothetical protein